MSESVATTEAGDADDHVLMRLTDASVVFDMERGTSCVLDSVDLEVRQNEILGVVGESGSGKSMLASAMLDAVVEPGQLSGDVVYQPPGEDPVVVNDLDATDLRKFRWEEVAMVFQGAMSSFNPTMSIAGHFVETAREHRYDPDERLEYARQLLSDLYLDPDRVLDSYPHELSGGMQQRVLIALSLLLEPELLVMDEPTAALDLLMQRSITNLLAKLKREYDLTILFITHDLPLVAGLCDRLAVMYAFQIVERGESRDVLKNAAHPYTRALLRAVPHPESPIDEMQIIEGNSPDPVNVPTGCSYHPRCPLATDECRAEAPAHRTVHDQSDHTAACFHWESAALEIPYELTGGSR